MTTAHRREVLIIGAGLAGLMAARHLQDNGLRVTVIDKGRSVGGRLATRRIGAGKADHGAQFFTVRDATFGAYVAEWQQRGLVALWSRGWSNGSLAAAKVDGFPRYCFKGGMNAMATTLAEGLTDVHLNDTIDTITPNDDGTWRVINSLGDIYTSRALILTPPVPQSLQLLAAGGTSLHTEDQGALEHITYAPALCGLILLDRPSGLPAPGAIQRPNYWVPWLADNQAKGISAESLLTIQLGEHYSRNNYDASDQKILADIEPEWRKFVCDAQVVDAQVKRWRYSRPTVMHPAPTLVAMDLPPLAFAGDAFNNPRIEGAALSGLAAAESVVTLLQGQNSTS